MADLGSPRSGRSPQQRTALVASTQTRQPADPRHPRPLSARSARPDAGRPAHGAARLPHPRSRAGAAARRPPRAVLPRHPSSVAARGLLTPGFRTNYLAGKVSRHIYLTASTDGAPLAAALAVGDGSPRVYRVEPTGPIYDDPNVTDKKLPGNPTLSYRTTEPLRVVDEVAGFDLPDPAIIDRMRANAAALRELGIEAMD